MSAVGTTPRNAGAVLHRRWNALGLRWQLVALNIIVVVFTVALIIVLMHNIAQQQFMVIMHAAGQPIDPSAGQRAYDAAVEAQIYPTIAVAAIVAVGLSFATVTLALRPLTAVRDATRRMARGDAPALIRTDRRDEIGDVADSVNELAESLRRLEDLRRQVTNDAAHELRTPLHNLLGLIEGMRDGVIPPTPARLQQAHNELGRLIALVEDLRGLADAQLARDRMVLEPLHLEAVVREAVLSFNARFEHRDLRCEIHPPESDLIVDGDAGRLGQVIGNLIDNAIRCARPGSVITAGIAKRGAFARVAIHDIGETIDNHSLPHIFERFFRADPSRTRGSGGAGIGLAIVKELIEAHGGNVGADSTADAVTVWFDLPLRDAALDATTPSDTAPPMRSVDAAAQA
ncbi:MAG TPA: ATP-binding protein [Candidatus Saccharimonadales bacterium]|nr:ATP-binding protein [Candidatus Saccharimonadales bacterium]